MPTTDQKADLLFKKYLGKGSSGTSSFYFNEPRDGRSAVFPLQIWQDQSLIPISASAIPEVVVKVNDAVMIPVPGQNFAFYSDQLKDAIPFNYDFSGSYVPVVKKSDDSVVAFGENDWVIDIDTGMLTFYAGLPSGVSSALPPKVSFWKYIGGKGIPIQTGSMSSSWADTASWAESSSWAITSSYTMIASWSLASFTAISAINSFGAVSADSAISSSWATDSGHANTASWAVLTKTASFIGSPDGNGGVAGGTASHAMRSETAIFSDTASYAYYAQVTLGTASYAFEAVHAGNASVASNAIHANNADTASYVSVAQNAITASYALIAESYHADTASYLSMAGGTASYAMYAHDTLFTASWSMRGNYAISASHAELSDLASNSISSSYAMFAQVTLGTSSHAITADYADVAGYATNSDYANASNTANSASYVYQSQTAKTASIAVYAYNATSASYAYYAQVVLGTSSYAEMAEYAISASYAHTASWAVSSSHAERAEYTYGTSSYSDTGTHAFTASYVSSSASYVGNSTTASYAHFAQVALGTASYSLTASLAQRIIMADSASVAIYAISGGYAFNAGNAATANLALKSLQAVTSFDADNAAFASYAAGALSSSFAETSSHAYQADFATTSLSTSFADNAVSASYSATASYFAGGASGSIITIGLPTDGYYGSGSNGNIGGLASGDRVEDAFDKLDSILDRLVPTRPPNVSAKSLSLTSAYSARMAGTNAVINTVTDDQTPSFQMVGGMIATNAFGDANNGTISALIDGISIGDRALTPNDDTGNYGGLQITQDQDYYLGQSGKAGFWYALLAQINVQTPIDDALPHTASIVHSLTGTSSPSYFYIDNPSTSPNLIASSVEGTGVVYISGVPALVGGQSGSAIHSTATASAVVGRFYNSTRVFSMSGTGISPINFALPSAPAVNSVVTASINPLILAGTTSENPSFTVIAYNSKGTTASQVITNTRLRMDSTLDTSNRLASGIGQYPSSGYGIAFDATENLVGIGNEELQMYNGQYRYPAGNYTGSLPVAGPDYTSVPIGSYNSYRWVTFNAGTISSTANLTITFLNSANFNNGGSPMAAFALQVRVNGATPTNGWVDGNVAYPGVGSPTNSGDAALVVANSNNTVKVVTFGTVTKTGTAFIRVGIPLGDTKRFGGITVVAS